MIVRAARLAQAALVGQVVGSGLRPLPLDRGGRTAVAGFPRAAGLGFCAWLDSYSHVDHSPSRI